MQHLRVLPPIALLALSLAISAPTPAQPPGGAAQKSSDQVKRQAEAQKKAAGTKEKWLKAQENTKNKEAELERAKQQEEQARVAAKGAQDTHDRLKEPVPSSAEASAPLSTDQTKQEAAMQKKAAEAKEKWASARDNTTRKQADLEKAKQDEQKARAAAEQAQAASNALTQSRNQ